MNVNDASDDAILSRETGREGRLEIRRRVKQPEET